MTDWSKCAAVESAPDRLSGAWVFTRTRVPVSALFGNLVAGATVKDSLEWFPGVEEWQVKAVLEHEVKSLDASAPKPPPTAPLPAQPAGAGGRRAPPRARTGQALNILRTFSYNILRIAGRPVLRT